MTRPLWAPWRLAYIGEAGSQETCVFCAEAGGELGEESLLVARGEHAFVLLNKFPYSSGHLMVASLRHVGELAELARDEAAEIHELTTQAIAALRAVYAPDAFNVGWNLGQVAGGSIGLGLTTAIFTEVSGRTLRNDASELGIASNTHDLDAVRGTLAGTDSAAQVLASFPQTLADQLVSLAGDAFVTGMQWALRVDVLLALGGFLVALFFVGGPLRDLRLPRRRSREGLRETR